MTKVLDTYFQRLTNLPNNSRSLLLLDLPGEFFLDLKSLDDYSGQKGFGIIDKIINGNDAIQIVPFNSKKDLGDRIKAIHHNEQIIFEERGARDLYVGWPFVSGKFLDGTVVRCPLLFFPLSLALQENGWVLQRREGVNITLNKTFILRYAYHNKAKLDEDLIEQVFNTYDTDSTLFRMQLYELLKNSSLEIDFNKENFIDDLSPFKSTSKESLEKSGLNGQLKLYPQAILGIFPQSGAYLVADYGKLLVERPETSLSDFLSNWSDVSNKKGTIANPMVREETIFTPFPLDSYQEKALHLIKSNRSLLVQGPPGTGKTQMICNMISDFIARGKTVLFVSQKKTALDVAYRRLQSQELHDFIGLVHDFKNNRKDIYSRIIKQIKSVDDYRQKNNALDPDELEKSFLSVSRKIDAINDELEEYKSALFDENECGKSAKELYLISNKAYPFIHLNQVYRNYDFKQIEAFYQRLSGYMLHFRNFESISHFWTKGPSFASFGQNELEKIHSVIEEVYDFRNRLKIDSKSFTKNEIDFETALFFLSNKESLELLAANLKNETTYNYYIHMVDTSPTEDASWLSKMERIMLQCFKGSGPETSLPSSDLGRFQEALEHAIRARKGIFSWLRWRLFSEDKIFITRVLVANELKSNKNGFETLLKMIDNRLNFEHSVSEIRDIEWLKDFPDSFRVIDIQNWFFYQKLALKSYQLRQIVRSLPNYLLAKDETRERYIDTIHQLISLVEKIPKKLKKWGKYISEAQVRLLLLDKVSKEEAIKMLNTDFSSLGAYHNFRDSFDHEEIKMINELAELESKGEGKVEDLFFNSICIAWIDHIEQKYPVLKSGSTTHISELSKDLQLYVEEKIRVSQAILLLNTRRRTYESLEYDSTNGQVTYKELLDLLTSDVRKWPIRRLIANYQDEILSLLPCWIASPESASAIFPMKKVFDLVIFDESSQCPPERAIPTMYRGHAIVVVGDEKQLPPNELFDTSPQSQPSTIDPDNSLVKMVKGQFPEVLLRRHYRSKSLALIDFSNQHFYQDQLKFIPYYSESKQIDSCIKYHQVAGREKNGYNTEEAFEVVKIIKTLLKESDTKSIGVIVPGTGQQTLLVEILSEYATKEKVKIPASLFIKTIENVQGDEYDAVILSTVWDHHQSPPMYFGFENLINVAITRAKELMFVVTSLHPEKPNEAHHQGVKSLKDFLHYAYAVSKGTWQPRQITSFNHEPDWFLKNYITKHLDGKELSVDELTFSDLVIKKKEKYYGAIITDDQLFEETPKEAYCHKYNLLRERKWPFIQLSSREFWAEKALSFDKLRKFTFRETN